MDLWKRERCNLIITTGYLMGDATRSAAERNPDQKFSIADFLIEPAMPNVASQVFDTNQASFLAGYLAAGVTHSGKVGTYGGVQIPPVVAFMDGFALGVQHYNRVHGKDVQVIGWKSSNANRPVYWQLRKHGRRSADGPEFDRGRG